MISKVRNLLRASESASSTLETPQRLGVPQPCPDCGRGAFLARIDTRRRTQYQFCERCELMFSWTEAPVEAPVAVAS